jgi:outer membrane immunogenic protein
MKHITTILLATVAAAGLMSSAYAADLIIEEPAEVGVVDVSGSWDGAYIGVFAGAGWGFADHNSGSPPGFPDGYDIDLSGWLLGVQVGANFTVGSGLVAGVVADAAWTNIEGELVTGGAPGTITQTIDWMATLRGKLGFDGGAFMPYLTGGLAVAGATRESSGPDVSDTQTHIGWTVGAGVDFAVTEDVSINLEYLYADLGEQEYDTGGIPPTVDLSTHQIRVGLNWQF